ncbi:hypothetical protein LXA26_18030, partial [Erwinia amylovora]
GKRHQRRQRLRREKIKSPLGWYAVLRNEAALVRTLTGRQHKDRKKPGQTGYFLILFPSIS